MLFAEYPIRLRRRWRCPLAANSRAGLHVAQLVATQFAALRLASDGAIIAVQVRAPAASLLDSTMAQFTATRRPAAALPPFADSAAQISWAHRGATAAAGPVYDILDESEQLPPLPSMPYVAPRFPALNAVRGCRIAPQFEMTVNHPSLVSEKKVATCDVLSYLYAGSWTDTKRGSGQGMARFSCMHAFTYCMPCLWVMMCRATVVPTTMRSPSPSFA